ncbi:MAG: hypothetical protein EZS28_014280 [Streblomastix strix]|uniref:HECT-type E3 ubiquitin transferase n=1 Tax=Streblomastix strix TaxID=222440 RepID=A0A5J4W6B1_9EUKA|nr:MAG: hypothetical protein EZS28_014280 [Streblomastix strix]
MISSISPQILYFWDMILDMSNEQRAYFLQFATGTTLLPPGGFMNLMGSMGPRKFTIYRSTKRTQYHLDVHHFTFDKATKLWKPKLGEKKNIGRLYNVSPKELELL